MKGYNKHTGEPIFKTHGMSNTRFWVIYRSILQRCNDINAYEYPRYGKRGIKCLWESFEDFYKDMYEPYLEAVNKYGEKRTSIDRIDNNGNYCKENCRWADPIHQSNNRRNNHYVSFNGETKSIMMWSREYGLAYRCLYKRVRSGWDIRKALTTPSGSS